MAKRDAVADGIDYAERVVGGKISAPRLVRLACERFVHDLELAESGNGLWAFKPDKARAPLMVCEGLPNIKGPAAGNNIRLMGWQRWCTVNLFAFVERETGLRRFRQASIWVPRGNGKSTWVAPLGLYCAFADDEGGAEAYAAAVTRDQAKIVWSVAWEMSRRSPGFRKSLGIETSVNSIYQDRTASKFVPISSDSKGLEGLNVHFAVLDEIGSHRTGRVYDVILTGLGKRLQPLLISISTATADTTGVGKQLWDYTIKVLDGIFEDDRFFGVIYAAEPDENPWDERVMRKVNPGWGITVVPEQVRMIARQARNNPAQEAIYKTRHLNLWVTGNVALFSMDHWKACRNDALQLDDFEGKVCLLGLDIANKIDLTCATLVFYDEGEDGELRYTIFCRAWIPDARIEANPSYANWIAAGWLHTTPGETTDFSEIETFIEDCCLRFEVQAVPYDPWSATQLAQRMMEKNVPMVEYPMNVSTMSEPTKIFDARMREHRIAHDGNPVLAWCVSNVVGRYDAKEHVFPRKELPANKIDGAIAAIMAIGQQVVAAAEGTETIYRDTELRIW